MEKDQEKRLSEKSYSYPIRGRGLYEKKRKLILKKDQSSIDSQQKICYTGCRKCWKTEGDLIHQYN